jgi:glycosyltransferase involved in cell wall biosynthesis
MGVADRFQTLLPQRQWLLKRYRGLAPAYPGLVSLRKLPPADVLLSSSYAFSHGFKTRNDAPQVCYCYSPLRFAWSMTEDYGRGLGAGRGGSLALRALARPMRWSDRRFANRVETYIAESRFVADQIERFYERPAEVLWPPVDCDRFHPAEQPEDHDDYFLFCGRLIEPYKRPTLAVEAFRGLSQRLLVAGDGPELDRLRRTAPDNVEFLGAVGDGELIPLMQRCAAAVFPSRDDFGLIPVEVMACGRPVIAFGAGGALETIAPGRTGELFGEQTAAALRSAVRELDPSAYDPAEIRTHAEQWAAPRFRDAIHRAVLDVAAGAGR